MKPVLKIWIAFCFCLSPFTGQALLIDKTLARIGEEMISLMDLNLYRKRLMDQTVPSTPLSHLTKDKTLIENRNRLLDHLIYKQILKKLTKDMDFEPSEKQIQQTLRKIRGSSSHKSFIQKLNRNGLSLKDLRKEITFALKANLFLQEEVIAKIIISDNDINSHYFNRHGRGLFKSFEYDVSSLSFPRTDEGIKNARSVLKSHLPFEEVGKALSGQFKTDRLKTGDMQKAMEQALKSLSVSSVSEPIPLSDRLYIFRLNWKTPLMTRAEEKVKQRIKSALFKKEVRKALKKWLEEKKADPSVKILSA